MTNSIDGVLPIAGRSRGERLTTANASATSQLGAQQSVRVWLIDRCPVLLEGVSLVLSRRAPEITVIGSSAQLDDALSRVAPGEVDVVICDVVGRDDVAVLAKLPTLIRATLGRALVFASGGDSLFYKQLVIAGARGVVSKSESSTTLIKAIHKVHEGEIWLDRHVTSSVFDALVQRRDHPPRDHRMDRLTARERHLMVQLDKLPGASNKVLARQLNLSENTVRNHLSSIYMKLGVSGRLELYAQAHAVESKAPARKQQ